MRPRYEHYNKRYFCYNSNEKKCLSASLLYCDETLLCLVSERLIWPFVGSDIQMFKGQVKDKSVRRQQPELIWPIKLIKITENKC